MSSSKIFAGSRLRRIRNKLAISQTAFAQSLGLSPSYLNLMERDQRPLTAQVVLKLSAMEGVDVAELTAGEQAHALLQPLREMLADPLLLGEVPPGNELSEALQIAPNFAAAALKLFSAYRELQKRTVDAARGLPLVKPEPLAIEWLAGRNNDDLEGLAEDIWSELSPKDDIFAGLKARLRESFGIDTRILPKTVLGTDRSRYDRHSQRLMISETLDFADRILEAAHLVARLEARSKIEEIEAASPAAAQSTVARSAKAALLDHLALAILTPRGKFRVSAEDLKHDVDALAKRFSTSPGRAMQRLAVLQDDLSYLAVEANGQIIQRIGKLPFFIAHDQPLCQALPLFDDKAGIHVVEMVPNDGQRCLALALHEGRRSHALFYTTEVFAKTAFTSTKEQRPLGATCRLCDIKNCTWRSAASASRPAGLNDYIRSVTDFEPI